MPVRIMTLNVRYAVKKTLLPNEQPWEVRCPKIASQLRLYTTGQENTFICTQEVQHQQLLDLQTELGARWAQIGRGRADEANGGEFSPIFYQADHWSVERTKTYWLSPTPETPSNAWGATINRIVTVGLFKHKDSKTRVIVMSTHLDHKSYEARRESAKLLLEIARNWKEECNVVYENDIPTFLGGDFNSGPEDEPHRLLTASFDAMRDMSDLVPAKRHYGNKITYTTFGEAEPATIDYLFVLSPKNIEFCNFAVLENRFDDGVYYSDHRPVLADVEVPVITAL
ncbi:endonuclease exonuclease phosphatase family protein [Colletotrichum incanum]|uniref:Endonuclease exonuclease phosphatase family protein n=1 Tax=Colletotrichum incanum TaxID=1573173 RepID=A0A161VHQ3_COLIC|nr:endonuclease exonuclease phosphatase family protein [Colletotrichum incanum]OHW99398.1 endonuclease exonuclease phosphatase [Colletotrichum incanum]